MITLPIKNCFDCPLQIIESFRCRFNINVNIQLFIDDGDPSVSSGVPYNCPLKKDRVVIYLDTSKD